MSRKHTPAATKEGEVSPAVTPGHQPIGAVMKTTYPFFFTRRFFPPGLRRATVTLAALAALAWSGPAFCGEIHDAARRGDLVEAKALLKESPDLVFSKEDGQTPLLMAAAHGHKDVAELLLSDRAVVNEVDKGGRTSLHLAAAGGYEDVAELLLAHHADIDATDFEGKTPLYWAAATGNKDVAELLWMHGGAVWLRECPR
jgi:Ankyrin repeats (3 copies)/Ankyrin repeat